MRKQVLFVIFLFLLTHVSLWSQIGGDYNPDSPSDPDAPTLKYSLIVKAFPEEGGSFNISKERVAAGFSAGLYAYPKADYTFSCWMIGDSVLSTASPLEFIMPAHDVTITGKYEYNPTSPANPASNYWDSETGEVIIDDFTPGNVSNAIYDAINKSESSNSEVNSIIVAGQINSYDFSVANYYENCTLLDLSRVNGVTEVPSWAFDYSNLESIYLPYTIDKIGYGAFLGCSDLISITCYALTPPTLDENVFSGVPEGLVIYVPAAAIPQYQETDGWKNFTILPIQEDIRNISVSLPTGANPADFAQMWLELTNTKSGQRMHYVLTDRTTYIFQNIIRNTSWNIVLRNERGDIFGQIDDVEVKDEDVSVSFTQLSRPQNLEISVLTPEGKDVTDQTQITWVDVEGNYLSQSSKLSGLPVGFTSSYRISLSQELAMLYDIPSMGTYTLKNGNNHVVCRLAKIAQVTLSGTVKDASTNMSISGATISASQTFGGKYSKTVNTTTAANGQYSLTLPNVPTTLAIAAPDHVSQTFVCDSLMPGSTSVIVPTISLKEISGAVLTIGLTYTACPTGNDDEDNVQEWYSDYNNISYSIYNKTKRRNISQFNVQYPQIVLLETIDDGDVLELTATSRVSAFMPVISSTTVQNQRADIVFNIVELGKIQASFSKNGNASVVGSLYDEKGKLIKTYNYTNATLTIEDLADGNYTLVTMGSSTLFNTIYDLVQLPQTGLSRGVDYVQSRVEVKSGNICSIDIAEVPTLNESKLYYTGRNTSFTVNKSSIVVGNYLTLTGHIDFKPAYATSVSNVQMIVDLPESCQFVENSVMVGNSTSSYTINGYRITIPLTQYTDRVRFCVIPTLGGNYAPSAFAQFNLNGKTVTQPIGSANYTAKDLSISVPSTVAKTSVPISGTAIGTSTIDIYDNDVLIGQTTSLANGTWATTCELNEPYNLSTHNIFAKITTKSGLGLVSETKSSFYDKNAIEVKTVTMINFAHHTNDGQEITVFDFQNPTKSMPAYWYWPDYPDFTFITDFTNNDSTMLLNVEIGVLLSTGETLWLPAHYDGKADKWITTHKFNSYELPRNVSISYMFFNRDFTDNTIIESHFSNNISDSIHGICSLDKDILSLTYTDDNGNIYAYGVYGKLTKDKLSSLELNASESGYQTSLIDDCLYCYKDEGNIMVVEQEDSIVFHMMFTPLLEQEFHQWKMWLNGGNIQSRTIRRAYEISYPRNILERARDAQIQGWIDMAREKMECAGDETEVLLWDAVRRLRNSVTYINASFFASVANLIMSGMRENGNKVERAFGYGWNAGNAIGTAANFAPGVDGLNRQAQNAIEIIRNAPSCHPPRNPHPYPGDGPENVQDPSGYVYEGVTSNRIEGVTATAFYKEMVEDMYGDLHENIVKWNAEEYAQENPLFTDENGMYAWDVPQGLWQVKFEKEGYETTYSEWLPVPPPQLDINIAMKQNVQPNVKNARAYGDAVEVEFDKYMLPEYLTTDNIVVMCNNNVVEGTVVLLNEEVSYEGASETFASKVRFNAVEPFDAKEVTLIVNNRVRSYAGIRMQDNFSQTFDVELEAKEIVCDANTILTYGENGTLAVRVLPASAAAGKTLYVKTSSPMILDIDEESVTLDNQGQAIITITGNLPGTAALTFSLEGYDLSATTIVNIEQKSAMTVANPTANIASGSIVERGTAIYLSCETNGATIYYTLDGSCPCDESSSRKIYDGTPIIINDNVNIRVWAIAPDMYESDVIILHYVVEGGNAIDVIALNGKINIYPLPVRDKLTISTEEHLIKKVTLNNVNGSTLIENHDMAKSITLDVSHLTTGIYIINIVIDDKLYSKKIIKAM